MKNFLFFAVANFVLVYSAVTYATPSDKGGPSWRSPASSDPPPWWLPQSPACRLVKERIGKQHGHVVYQTRQVCG